MTHTATSASGSSRGHEAKLASTSGPDRGRHEAYETDIVSRGWTTAGIVAAAFGGGLFYFVVLVCVETNPFTCVWRFLRIARRG